MIMWYYMVPYIYMSKYIISSLIVVVIGLVESGARIMQIEQNRKTHSIGLILKVPERAGLILTLILPKVLYTITQLISILTGTIT